MSNTEYSELDKPQEQGSFLTGFTLGVFAGAAGYYLFATENGEKLRRRLKKEWEEAKANMVAEGVITNNKLSLREFLQEFFVNTLHTPLPSSLMGASLKAKKQARPSSKSKKGSANRFRGI